MVVKIPRRPTTRAVVSIRRLDEIEPAEAKIERDPSALSAMYAAQKRIGAATDLDEVLAEIADAVLALVPSSTHVTVVLRDDDQELGAAPAAFVPVLTRVRSASGKGGPPTGLVPITRSVYRKVDQASGRPCSPRTRRSRVGQSESLMGALDPLHARASRSGRARRSSACSRPTTGACPEC